jgi:hypothetical protein
MFDERDADLAARAVKHGKNSVRRLTFTHRLPHASAKIGQILYVCECELLSVIFYKEKPVASPRNIPGHFSQNGHAHRKILFLTPTRNVGDRNLAVGVQLSGNDTDSRLDAMFAGLDSLQVSQRDNQSDGAVAAHAQEADVVEKITPAA